jgi:uncharacterized OsmC-like protein
VGVAREFNIPLQGVEVRVSHKQNMLVTGPNDPKQRQMRVTHLYRRIQVRGPISEEGRQRLLWGAENCPVHNSIGPAIPTETTLDVVTADSIRAP